MSSTAPQLRSTFPEGGPPEQPQRGVRRGASKNYKAVVNPVLLPYPRRCCLREASGLRQPPKTSQERCPLSRGRRKQSAADRGAPERTRAVARLVGCARVFVDLCAFVGDFFKYAVPRQDPKAYFSRNDVQIKSNYFFPFRLSRKWLLVETGRKNPGR